MNPIASHWLRLAVWLLVATPVVAFLVSLTAEVDFTFSLIITFYVWALVCVILALIAFIGLVVRLIGRGMRAIRR
jgi:hypothetical protein